MKRNNRKRKSKKMYQKADGRSIMSQVIENLTDFTNVYPVCGMLASNSSQQHGKLILNSSTIFIDLLVCSIESEITSCDRRNYHVTQHAHNLSPRL